MGPRRVQAVVVRLAPQAVRHRTVQVVHPRQESPLAVALAILGRVPHGQRVARVLQAGLEPVLGQVPRLVRGLRLVQVRDQAPVQVLQIEPVRVVRADPLLVLVPTDPVRLALHRAELAAAAMIVPLGVQPPKMAGRKVRRSKPHAHGAESLDAGQVPQQVDALLVHLEPGATLLKRPRRSAGPMPPGGLRLAPFRTKPPMQSVGLQTMRVLLKTKRSSLRFETRPRRQ